MGRYTDYTQNDRQPLADGDNGFVGMNAKIDRALLKPSLCAAIVNKRLLRGVAETRPGMVTPVALNSVNEPIYGAGIYSDPNDTEWLMLAVASGVYRCRWDRLPDWIGYFDGERVNGPCELVQCFDKVLLFRGPDAPPLEWDGTQSGLFRRISQSGDGTGINPIPNAVTGEIVSNRLLVPTNRDEVAVSDILDYTRYDSIMSQFRINSGTDETLVRLFPYTTSSVLAFKTNSVWQLSNLVGTWADNARLDVLNPTIGCAARESVATVGADVFWLSRTGVYRILQVIQGRIQTAPVPVSDPIEPIINRINWTVADKSVAVVWGQYYLLAVPLDGASVNNAILRFNTVSGEWEGYDVAGFPFGVSKFLVTDYQGAKRLLAVDFANRRVFVLDEGRGDIVAGTVYPVADLLETRGYTLDDALGAKLFRGASAALATWAPCYTIEAITDGVNEVTPLLTGATKDRTRYAGFGRTDWDASNAAGDQLAPGREDYSLVPSGVYCGAGGLRMDLNQEFVEPLTLRARGRWLSLRITNTTGRCDVRAVGVNGVGLHTEKETL